MSDKITKSPQIRFAGFTDAWEQCRLGSVADFSKGNGYTKNDLRDTGFPVVLYGRLYTKYETIINNVDTFVEMKDKSVISEGNEVVVPASGESAEDISRASVIGKPGLILGGDLNIIKPKQEVNSTFLALTISNGTQQKEMSKRAQGKSVVHLHNSDLKEINLLYPKLEEQQQIGTFFTNIDNLLTLHQRNLELLKDMKKSLLQKMFPKDGANVPEIRFAGFADAWEQHSLSKVGDFVRTSVDPQATPHASFVEYSMPSYDNGRKPEVVFGDSMQSIRLKVSGDVLLINKLNVRQKRIWFVEDAPSNAVASSEFMPFTSTEIDLAFLEQLMLSDKTTRDLESISSGTSNSQKRITPSDVLKYIIKFPVDRAEQEKIGSFFKNIDNLIIFHQRELNSLENLKKSLLQQMFI
ncbi:restriction endonuclease subunit S [Bacillus pumilus]|uniref:restriction endonuclease subunit S n=1 Tax=Bacillus pumilus TaxID=1408 RepID=UPI00165838DA|nr:restriction endonuclease subunit S [Bacillus pumilus]QNP15766.1 restriction endonuclease subunit S [Bacillus pumilus]